MAEPQQASDDGNVAGIPGLGTVTDKVLDWAFDDTPDVQFGRQSGTRQLVLSDPSQQESMLAGGAQDAAMRAFGIAGGGGPEGLTERDIILGNIGPEAQRRIDQQAFAGFDELLARAGAASRARAAQTGLPGSSQEAEFFGMSSNPLIAERSMLRANLIGQEIQRRQALRNQILQNLMAVQASPELSRLFQERLATGIQRWKSTSRQGSEGKVKRQEQDEAVDAAVAKMTPEQRREWDGAQILFAIRKKLHGTGIGDQQLELLREMGLI